MTFPHRRRLGVEAFEDRVLLSSPGFQAFSPGAFGPAHSPGGDGFDHHDAPGPFRPDDPRAAPPGGADVRRDITAIRLSTHPASRDGDPPTVLATVVAAERPAEDAARPPVPTPAGLSVTLPVRFVAGGDARPFFGPDLVSQPAAPAAGDYARPVGVPVTPSATAAPVAAVAAALSSAGTVLLGTTAAEPTDPRVTESIVRGPESPAVADAPTPIEVDLPGAVPLAGLLGVDAAALEGQARQLLARVADLAGLPDELGGAGGSAWLPAAAVLTGGVGYALWANRRWSRTGRPALGPDSVLVRWGEEHGARVL
jgi:hypothetical protein